MFFLLVGVYIVLFLWSANFYARRGGYWHPVTLFGISGFYYYLGVPLELQLKHRDLHMVEPTLFYLPYEARVTVALLAVLALLGFVFGYHMSGMQRVLADIRPQQREPLPWSLTIICFGLLGMLFAVYGTQLFQQLSYHEANEMRYNDSFFSYCTRMLMLAAAIVAGAFAYQRRFMHWGFFASVGGLVGWGFFTSDKNPLLMAAMGMGTYWIGSRSRSKFYLAFYCSGALAVTVLLPAFSAWRVNATPNWAQLVESFTLEHQDANGPMMSLSSAINGDEHPLYGSSYLYAMGASIPRSIWPDRPYDLAQEFAHENVVQWKPGLGFGYSLLAEAYLNFGYLGTFLQYFVTGYGLNRLWLALMPLFANRRALGAWAATLSVVQLQMIVVMHRAPISMVAQTCLREFSIFVIALIAIDARIRHKNRQAQAAPSRSPPISRPMAA